MFGLLIRWSRVQREIEFRERYAQDQVSFSESAPANFMTICQLRLREIGKAEEVLRASFRELNSNMNSWNREFFEGLRFALCLLCDDVLVTARPCRYLQPRLLDQNDDTFIDLDQV